MSAAFRRGLFVACAAGATMLGCDGPPPAAIDLGALPVPTYGTAMISGTIRFAGSPPPLPMIDTRGTCKEAAPIQSESIVVSRAGGLRDVIVSLADAPPSSGAGRPSPTLDQVGCRYEPHVLAAQIGQPITIRSSDKEFHNVHWVAERNPSENLAFNHPGETKAVVFREPEFLRLRCDVHAWMESYVGVMPNPFFAVTDADGHFTIARVPAGTYRAVAWHPLLGTRGASVTVGDGGVATLDVAYARPG